MREMAQRISAYYTGLVDGGVTPTVATYLVIDYQRLALCKAFWPDSPPLMGHPLLDD